MTRPVSLAAHRELSRARASLPAGWSVELQGDRLFVRRDLSQGFGAAFTCARSTDALRLARQVEASAPSNRRTVR